MTDEAAFIQMIREHPDDDGPRLVYADWLEEHGECERAEFIRVQIELARGGTNRERLSLLQTRENELLAQHEREWIEAVNAKITAYGFRRGMLEAIEISAPDLQDHATSIFERAPVLRIRIRQLPTSIVQLSKCKALAGLRGLDLSRSYLLLGQLRPLLASPHVHQIQSLDLSMNYLANDDVQDLTDYPCLENVRQLNLSGVLLRGGEWIRDCERLPKLNQLGLGSNAIGDDGIGVLVSNSKLKLIRELDFSHCQFGAPGAEAIAASKRLLRLNKLDLGSNPIGDAGAESLANSPLLGGLESLSLRDCDIGWPGAKAIAQSQMLEGLKHLDLSGNRLNSRQQNRLELRFGSRVKL